MSFIFSSRRRQKPKPPPPLTLDRIPEGETIGLIAGNSTFPLRFADRARARNCRVVSICHHDETLTEISSHVDESRWIKVGQLGAIIEFFKSYGVTRVAMVGGINRVRLFGGVKLDARGAALLLRLRSSKDDVIMRGIADELANEGIEVISSVVFMQEDLVPEGIVAGPNLSRDEQNDIEIGRSALRAMSGEDIGQLVVVRDGVIVAVEAVEGSDATIRRGGELGGKGTVVVKCAKPTQDMRFDVPIVGEKTLETLAAAGARVMALEAGRCLILDREDVAGRAEKNRITIVGTPPLV